MKSLFSASWRTTLTAFLVMAVAIGKESIDHFDADDSTVFSVDVVMLSIGAFISSLFTRDNAVSSEQAGAGVTPPK